MPACPARNGLRVTTHTTVEIEIDKDGNQVPKTREYTAACGTCHGSGEAH